MPLREGKLVETLTLKDFKGYLNIDELYKIAERKYLSEEGQFVLIKRKHIDVEVYKLSRFVSGN